MALGLEPGEHVSADARLDVRRVRGVIGQEGADQEARTLDRLLDVHPVVEEVREHLDVEHRLAVAAHRREAQHRAVVARREGRHQCVEGSLAGREERRMTGLEAEVPAAVLQHDARARRHDARAEAVEEALDDADHVPSAVGHDEARRVALGVAERVRPRLVFVEVAPPPRGVVLREQRRHGHARVVRVDF